MTQDRAELRALARVVAWGLDSGPTIWKTTSQQGEGYAESDDRGFDGLRIHVDGESVVRAIDVDTAFDVSRLPGRHGCRWPGQPLVHGVLAWTRRVNTT